MLSNEGEILEFSLKEATDLVFSKDCIMAHTPNLCFTHDIGLSHLLKGEYVAVHVSEKEAKNGHLFIQANKSVHLFKKVLREKKTLTVKTEHLVAFSKKHLLLLPGEFTGEDTVHHDFFWTLHPLFQILLFIHK
eukprot:TRINITY_DN2500_c0_g2_i4.p2 TRINITY_DN2500_c0_g2~~TRINITY_DN2500_c0_g2_i4.p2  ORF type:complete len:134 (+),score=9.29 TRINITY_DN2500_c0_g2_i4:422-823(+)